MDNVFVFSEGLNRFPLAIISGILWLSWLVAILFMLFARNGKFNVLHGRILILPAILLLCWHALIMVSSGESPIIKRSALAGVIRLLDLVAILLLWLWLILTLKRRIIITETPAS
jgi:hypothetical protein